MPGFSPGMLGSPVFPGVAPFGGPALGGLGLGPTHVAGMGTVSQSQSLETHVLAKCLFHFEIINHKTKK